jgi:hypothetical protein
MNVACTIPGLSDIYRLNVCLCPQTAQTVFVDFPNFPVVLRSSTAFFPHERHCVVINPITLAPDDASTPVNHPSHSVKLAELPQIALDYIVSSSNTLVLSTFDFLA